MYKSLKIEQEGWAGVGGDLSHKSQKPNNCERKKSPTQHVFQIPLSCKCYGSGGCRCDRKRGDMTLPKKRRRKKKKTLLNEPIIPVIVVEAVNQCLLRTLERVMRKKKQLYVLPPFIKIVLTNPPPSTPLSTPLPTLTSSTGHRLVSACVSVHLVHLIIRTFCTMKGFCGGGEGKRGVIRKSDWTFLLFHSGV